jgi:hypothetical protein
VDIANAMLIGLNNGESNEIISGNSTISASLAEENQDVKVTGTGFEVDLPLGSNEQIRRRL